MKFTPAKTKMISLVTLFLKELHTINDRMIEIKAFLMIAFPSFFNSLPLKGTAYELLTSCLQEAQIYGSQN